MASIPVESLPYKKKKKQQQKGEPNASGRAQPSTTTTLETKNTVPARGHPRRFLGYASARVICQNPHFRAKCALESLLKSKKTAINNDVQPYTLSLLRLIPKSRSARERTDPKMMAAERSRRTSYRRPARDSEITGALHYCRPAEAPGKMVLAGRGDVSRGGARRKKKSKNNKKRTPRESSLPHHRQKVAIAARAPGSPLC